MTTLAGQLGEWISGLSTNNIPDDLRLKAKDHLLDTIGAAIVGNDRRPTRIAEEVFHAAGSAPILIDGAPRHPVDAARVNAVAAHAAEIDDTEGCDHSGAVIVPTLLALSHDYPVSGDDLLTAMIAGYEIGRRVQTALGGYEAHNHAGWHSTATCGVFAAAASAARLLNLDGSQCTAALAIAASSSAGNWAFAGDGSMTKQLHVANAAGNGLLSALLAKSGASGPTTIFDDAWGGYFRTHGTEQSRPEVLTHGLGNRWHAAHSAIKMYAACRSAHPAIDGVIDLLASGSFSPRSVRSIRIELSPFLRSMICPDSPDTIEAARMSLPISIALLLLGRRLDPDSYAAFADTAVTNILASTEVVETEELRTSHSIRVTLRTETGDHTIERDSARGSETSPYTTLEVEMKFRHLTESRIGRPCAEELINCVYSLGTDSFQLPDPWGSKVRVHEGPSQGSDGERL